MKSQQLKCLLSVCNPLYLFTPCSALIDLRRCYRLYKDIVAKKACPVICTFDIYPVHACRRPQVLLNNYSCYCHHIYENKTAEHQRGNQAA